MIDKESLLFRIFQKADPGFIFLIVKFLQLVTFLIDLILDPLFGFTLTHGSRQERKEAEIDYEKSAQLVDVVAMGAWNYVMNHNLSNYFYLHRGYVSPRYVLERDNITLSAVTETHAVFCVSDPKDDVYDTSVVPFIFIVQLFEAKQLVIVPLDSFNQLADEAGDPRHKVVVLGNTARCGSTLLCQMFNQIPNTRTMSEPWGLAHLHGFYNRGKLSYTQYRKLVQSAVRLQCKDTVTSKTEVTLMKLPLLCSPQIPIIKELFPEQKYLYNTRLPRPSMLSFYKMFSNTSFCYHNSRIEHKFWWDHLPFPYDDKVHKPQLNPC